ncbi:hypothetical protein DSECCO2_426020 [anaerobic digester metagenome]
METSLERRVLEHLCRVYGLGLEEVRELYAIGRDTVGETLRRLDEARARDDWPVMADAAHMLKGTLFNMGLQELGEAARNLELAAKEGRAVEARRLHAELGLWLREFSEPAADA